MGIEAITTIDFQELSKACESLFNTMGVKIRTVGVKKVAVVTEFIKQLLAVPEAEEAKLEDIIFSVVTDIQTKLGTETLKQTLALLEAPVDVAPPVAPVVPAVPIEPVVPVAAATPEPTVPPPIAASPAEAATIVAPVNPVAVATPPVAADPPKKERKKKEKLPKEPKPPKEKKERKAREGNKVLDITRFVWKHTNLSIEDVAKAMTAANIPFSEATLGFEYRAVHRSRLVLKEMNVIK